MEHTPKNPFPFETAMQKAQGGDNAAYESLLKEISHILKGYLIKRVSHTEDIDDIIQEILVSIHHARHTYDTSRPFLPWMFAIAQFRMVDYFRKSYRHGKDQMVDFEKVKDIIPSEDVTEQQEMSELADRALASLPPKQRKILELMHLEGYTAKETGEQLGMSTSAVKVAAHRAYKAIRANVKDEER